MSDDTLEDILMTETGSAIADRAKMTAADVESKYDTINPSYADMSVVHQNYDAPLRIKSELPPKMWNKISGVDFRQNSYALIDRALKTLECIGLDKFRIEAARVLLTDGVDKLRD